LIRETELSFSQKNRPYRNSKKFSLLNRIIINALALDPESRMIRILICVSMQIIFYMTLKK
jgi:hypothetical protein